MAGELFVIACRSRGQQRRLFNRAFFLGRRASRTIRGCSETITSLGAGIEFHAQKNQASGFPDRPPKVRANEVLPR